MEFLVWGALDQGEPGVFVTFEETAADLEKNFASLGFDLPQLIRRKRIVIEHINVDSSQIEESGEYDLEGLFIRLEMAVASIGARRIALDTLESLFAGLSHHAVLRSELRRLFAWLKQRDLTAVITGERGDSGALTRQGLEEYVSDCVIVLDHRVAGQVSTRRLRVLKYRGSAHGNNEYPFLIRSHGISVYPLTSLSLNHAVSRQHVSSGIPALDAMLGGKGFYRGSSVLISGTAGSGKTTLAASFAAAACARGERCLYFAFEEAPSQIVRNMASVGLHLARWQREGRLRIVSTRPTYFGLEMHLVILYGEIERFRPAVVVLDPISNLIAAGTLEDAGNMLLRMVDYLKSRGVTALFTNLAHTQQGVSEETEIGISSLMDVWLLSRDVESGGERNRALYVLKARGLAHSNQIREFLITRRGIELREPYLGESGWLTGSARRLEEARTAEARSEAQERADELRQEARRTGDRLRARIAALQAELERRHAQAARLDRRRSQRQARGERGQLALAASRGGHPEKPSLHPRA